MAYEEKKDKQVEVSPRKGEGVMAREELQKTMRALLTDSKDYTDSVLSPEREKATKYYMAEDYGNEIEGRSQVKTTDVRDGVWAILPSLLKVLFGPEKPVEYKADKAEMAEQAAQATDYMFYVFMEDNPGFMETMSVLKDGLVRKIGIFKWWWDDSGSTKAYRLENISMEQLQLLAGDPNVQITEYESPEQGASQGLSVELTRTEPGRATFMAVPPEEFLYSREGRTIEDATLVAHWSEKTTGELLAMGISQDTIDEHGGTWGDVDTNIEKIARNPDASLRPEPDMGGGKGRMKHLYVESYPRIDADGDGTEELRKVCTLGPGFFIVDDYPCDERPFAIYVPDPEPHTIRGLAWSDRLMDIQLVRSMLMRAMNDSATGSLFPRPEYVEGMVNVADLLNEDLGAPIRTKGPGMLNMHVTPFMGKDLLGVLQYFDQIKEERTGHNGAIGLDPDSLQSSTKAAVGATVTATSEAKEMLARIFVEQCFKPLFRGLLRLTVKHQDRPRTVELRSKYVEVDPRVWNANMAVTVNVALGSTLVEDKIASLSAVLEKMELIFSSLGPDNDIFTKVEYRNTLAKLTELTGWKDSSQFWLPLTHQQLAEKAANAPPPPPTPEEKLAQAQVEIERMKAEAKLATDSARLELERENMILEDQREREKLETESALKIRELELKFQTDLNIAQIKADYEREAGRERLVAETERERMKQDVQAGPTRKRVFKSTRDADGKLVVEEHYIDESKTYRGSRDDEGRLVMENS